MALAIRFGHLMRSGEVTSYAELARLGRVTRARMTQVMALLGLAPDLQEEILFLGSSAPDRGARHLRQVRPIAAVLDWSQQRRLWRKLRPG